MEINFKKLFLSLIILALVISAVLGIYILLIDDIEGNLELQIFGTTLALGGYSLGGLCCSTIYPNKDYRIFSQMGMGMAVISFVLTMIGLWVNMTNEEDFWKIIVIFMTLTIAMGHSSLLLLIKARSAAVRFVRMMTFLLISLVSLMIVLMIFADFNVEEGYWRLLGILLILDVLGTLLTIVINKMSGDNN